MPCIGRYCGVIPFGYYPFRLLAATAGKADGHAIPQEKSRLKEAAFLSYSLLSEYQVQRQNRPNIIGLAGVEVV
jgi:hypothetical protein